MSKRIARRCRVNWLTKTWLRLIAACAVTSEDPVVLVSNAAQDHIPVNPSSILGEVIAGSSRANPIIPTSKDRPSIASVIDCLKSSQEKGSEYRDQIVYEH